MGGTIESDFEKFVAYNNSNLKSLQNIEYIYNPFSKEKIDFIHLIAIINVISKGGINNTLSNDMAGWGGDLCQLALELKNTGLTGTELQEKANQLFGAEVSTFSSQDLLADLDAVNIANIYLNNQNKSISQSIKEYYRSVNTDKRKADVIKATFSEFKNQDTLKSTEEITSLIITRLSKNSLISIWCSRNGISIKNNAEIFNSCAIAFAKYFTKTNRLVSFL